jgi:predicted  nucleic acid-binding Zn-ribbon protein
MENPELHTDTRNALKEVVAELVELRDSLVQLSMALHDLQFEVDLERRHIAVIATGELLKQIASVRNAHSCKAVIPR